jgi:hypothetical protein
VASSGFGRPSPIWQRKRKGLTKSWRLIFD